MSVSQKWISQNSTKGGPFESAGDQITEGGCPRPPKSVLSGLIIGEMF